MSGDTFEFDDRNHTERLVGTLHDPAATPGDVLTVQADKSIKAAAGGGGGGVQVVTVPVSSAQILDLANTPVVLIPGVPGFVTVVCSAVYAYLAGSTPYTDHGGLNVVLTGVNGSPWAVTLSGSGFWDQATDQVFGSMVSGGGVLGTASAYVEGLDIVFLNDTANPTDGDGTLLVTVSYFLAPTAP